MFSHQKVHIPIPSLEFVHRPIELNHSFIQVWIHDGLVEFVINKHKHLLIELKEEVVERRRNRRQRIQIRKNKLDYQ